MDTSEPDKGKGKKREYRIWTENEERALVNALKGLITKGMRCDNGFKSGYANLLEQMIKNAIPDYDLKSEPHITSKIHTWKKQYSMLKELFGASGTGVFTSTNMPDVSEEKWTAAIQRDRNFKSLRNKPFPFYNDWIEIFGKDRATGQNASTFVDAVNNVLNNAGTSVPPQAVNEEPQIPTPNFQDPVHEDSLATRAQVKRRRVGAEDNTQFVEAMTSFIVDAKMEMVQLNTYIGELAKRHGTNTDGRKGDRAAIYSALERFDYLTVDDRVCVTQYLCKNPNEMDAFLELPDVAKERYIVRILNP